MKKSLFTAFAVGLGLTANVFLPGQVLAQNVPSYVPTDGLVGWWPFNGNANDESGNGNNGTVNGATLTTDRFGIANQAMTFDGDNDYVEIAHNSTLNLGSVSISCWITPATLLTPSGFGPTILSKRESSGWGASFQMNIGNHDFWADWTIGSNSGIYHTDNTNLLINTNALAHIVYTHDANVVRLYLNGSLVEQINSPGLLDFNTLPLWFGARPLAGENCQFFNGIIDDIGIWNHSLTQQEIITLYNACSGNQISSQPSTVLINEGSNAQFTVNSATSSTIQWQSNPLYLGWQDVSNNSNYNGATTNSLTVTNTTVSNHNQPFRAIVNTGGCIDTSDVAVLSISNTCTSNVTVYDTLTTNVYDTLTTNITIYDTLTTNVYDTLTTNITIYDTLTTNVYDTLTTNITVYDTLTTNIYDTLTTNITVYDTITTNITIYDTLTTNVYDTTYITVSDTLLTTVTDTLIINTTLSLPAPNNENTILIYPNPASDHITIDNGNYTAMAGYTIRIENNAGQQVFQSAIDQQQFYVDLSTWTGNGLYFVHLIDPQNNTVTVRKIVLQ